MRLFSAIAVPDPVARPLSYLAGGLSDARWVEPADYHVTLGFFGEVERPVAEELAAALDEIAMGPIDLHLTNLHVFGAGKPHAIVALVERNPALLALEARHRAIAGRLGVRGDNRRFTPHVTLARFRGVPAAEVAAWVSTRNTLAAPSWRAEAFHLYSSRPSRGGGPYLIEESFRLAGAV